MKLSTPGNCLVRREASGDNLPLHREKKHRASRPCLKWRQCSGGNRLGLGPRGRNVPHKVCQWLPSTQALVRSLVLAKDGIPNSSLVI